MTESSRNRTCVICNKDFVCRSLREVACSPECKAINKQNAIDRANAAASERKREANNEKYKDVPDIPTCRVCGWKARQLGTHLRSHRLSVDEYRQLYNVDDADIFHSSYTNEKSKRLSGEKNPGYQHGGTMSSFSKKFDKYQNLTEDEKEAAISAQIDKANASKRTNHSYNTTPEFYMKRDGCSYNEAVKLVSERQTTFSREICIEKYGYDDGLRIFLARQEKWRKSLNDLPEAEKKRIRAAQFAAIERGVLYSKKSVNMFEQINIEGGLFGEREVTISVNDGERFIKPDYQLGNKIIEFNGDFWHASPTKYSPDSMLSFPGGKHVAASALWERDAARLSILHQLGYDVLIIWEHEYDNDPEGTIQKCKDFLQS